MAGKKPSLREAFLKRGLKEVSDSSQPSKRSTSLRDLSNQQNRRERSVRDKDRLDQSSYEERALVDGRGRGPDYQGPLRGAGNGTRDRMPGTTPSRERTLRSSTDKKKKQRSGMVV